MSGIYIPGMAMPERCGDCEIGPSAEMDGNVCPFYQLHGEEQAKFINIRHTDCPVIPVPDHGRLGDLDRLALEMMDAKNADQALAMVDDAPTIIPAEKEVSL